MQDIFLGEILGAVFLAHTNSPLNATIQVKPIRVLAPGEEDIDGQIVIDEKQGRLVKILENIDDVACYHSFADRLGDQKQSAVVGSFSDQERMWSMPHYNVRFLES